MDTAILATFRAIGLASIIALVSPGTAHAGPPVVDRTSASPVTTATARDIENLPQGRDLKAILELHNQLRTDVHAQPLRWDAALADHALAYARILAATGQLQHSSRVGRETERENLSLTPHGVTGPLDLARLWGVERQYFHPGVFPNICTGDWSQCAHYTQMIWPTTTSLGCGVYSGARYDALVCRYSPPGNRDGSPVIVLPLGTISQTPVVRLPAPETGYNGAPARPVACDGKSAARAPGRICATDCPGSVNKCDLSPPAATHGPERGR